VTVGRRERGSNITVIYHGEIIGEMIRKSGGGTNVTGTGVPRAFGIA
jgi:hypothetical protein